MSAAPRQRVAIVRHSFYPFELNVKREAEALRDAGYDVDVICLRNAGEAPLEVIESVNVHRLPVGHKRGKITRYLWEYNAFFVLAAAKLAALHNQRRFAAVQVNTMPDYLVFVALYPKLTGARVVLHLHEPVPELFGTMFPSRWYTRPFLWTLERVEQASIGFADRAITVTDQMRDNFVRRGADPDKIAVVVNVPDDRYFRIERYEHLRAKVDAIKKDERARGVFRVLTHGSIEERYGFDTIVRAVAIAKDKIPGIEFRFMGGGDHLPHVLALAKELGIGDRVHYLGFVPFEQMVEEILLADVCVVAVEKNPYSVLVHTNKMFEYMALERPVIMSRLDAVAAYMHDDAALYFDAGNHDELARRLIEVARDPAAAQARVRHANDLYREHRWENEKQQYLSRYRPA
ncbi:MAG TPA: glycosyltransferase family 4 protein [Candidatus Krumholzibacteria bacterium]|nr:glycosyltransferase family 4 protein [Candidatus Krumholzibacteria bacterium]